ncbi:MAG: HD family phosphohydrolase [Deltaproteobacteria bacterium HGW-Deltaproteobacteria-4]|nr:MAG: HD family phosphohydrolase [Deltaproteobacteria bacterium HGW-Deltaproteobacteria-4]
MKPEAVTPLLAFLRSLANAIGSAQLYSVEHPQVVALLPRAVDALHHFVGNEANKTLVFVKGVGFLQGKPLPHNPHLDRIAALCDQRGIGFIRFSGVVTVAEMRQLVRVLVGIENTENLSNSSGNICIGAVEAPESEGDNIREIASFEELSAEELKEIDELYNAFGQQKSFNLKSLASVIAGFINAFRREANPLLALVPLRLLDEYTFTHSVNVGILNIAQGMSLGIEGQLLHDLGIAGLLHDVGKIFTDQQLLKKPAALTTEEWQLMKRHPSRGAQYLLNQPDVPKIAVITAFEHHMRYDQTGYPRMAAGWKLSLCSQMTMISDTFDALRTRRIYKDSWDFPKISGHMLNLGGTQLNPELTLNFLNVLRKMEESSPERREGA